MPAAVIAFFVLSIDDGTDDAYAAWGAGEMVIDYMNTHSGRWPHDWNDLQPQFQVNNGRVGGWTFSQFQSHIYIDFNVNSEDLRAKAIASRYLPFHVIWPKRRLKVYIGGHEPNQMIFEYFCRQGPATRAWNEQRPVVYGADILCFAK